MRTFARRVFWLLIIVAAFAVVAEHFRRAESRVVDGDTLIVRGERIRLWGIDAPESAQTCAYADRRSYPCGIFARQYLLGLIGGDWDGLVCRELDRDRYGRSVARCCTRDREDLGALLVGSGWALDYTRYSGGLYRPAQESAEALRAGMWAGSFERPADYRRERRGQR